MFSTMKASIGLVMITLTSVLADMAGECDMVSLYQELGCTAVEPIPASGCPTMFQCPELHPDPTMCYYKGESYGDKSIVPQNYVDNPCMQACSCSVTNGEPEFRCAAIDCVETFGSEVGLQCIKIYELDSCCSSSNICGKDASSNLKLCEVEGSDRTHTYREGEIFTPLNTRKTCLCTPAWNNSVSDSYCRDINCGLELAFQNEIMKNCAPVFASNQRDCPINFVCPTPTSKVSRGLNIEGLVGECYFGNITLTIGDEVTVDDPCLKCACSVPPFASCISLTDCKSTSTTTA